MKSLASSMTTISRDIHAIWVMLCGLLLQRSFCRE